MLRSHPHSITPLRPHSPTNAPQDAHQRPFFPQRVGVLPIPPCALRTEFDVEIPQQPRKDDAHLVVSESLAQAGAWSNAERLHGISSIVVER